MDKRSNMKTCETCMWFACGERPVGRCRRRAPTLDGYPVVFVDHWCGDRKRRGGGWLTSDQQKDTTESPKDQS